MKPPFVDYLRSQGHEVQTVQNSVGELYIINGDDIYYQDIPKSKYAGIHRHYLGLRLV